MSSSEDGDGCGLPVSREKIASEIDVLIGNVGIDNLKSSLVRRHLHDKFNEDFGNFRKQIDEIIMQQVKRSMEKKQQPPPSTSRDSNSDSGSDHGVASTDIVRKKAANNKRKSSATVDDSDHENEDLMSSVKKRRRAATKTVEKKPRARKEGAGSKKNTGYAKFCRLSDELMAVTGKRYMPRHQVVKMMWAYARERDLLDPKDKRYARCDEPLLRIFKAKRFLLFGMMKALVTHIVDPKQIGPEAVAEAEMAEEEAAKEAEALEAKADGGSIKAEEEEEEQESD